MNLNSFKYKANYFATLLLAFAIPLERRFIAPATILFVATSLLNYRKPEKKGYRALYFGVIYLIYLFSLSYAPNLDDATTDLLTKLPLLLIPLSFYLSQLNFKVILPNIAFAFVLGCTVAFLASFVNSLIQFGTTADISSFFYDHISYFSHPGYMAMLSNFTILIMLLLRRSFKKTPQWLVFSLLFLHSAYLILLSSKTGLITMLLTYAVYVIYLMVKHKKYKTGIAILLASSIGLVAAFQTSNLFRNRILELSSLFREDQTSSTSARSIIWGISLDLIKEKPLLGYGVGNENQELEQRYIAENNEYLVEQKLNAHNQFLQTTLATGLPGGLILILLLVLPLWMAFRNNHPLYLGFILLVLVNFLTESMLERQVGVTFYAFFNLLLFASYFVSSTENDTPCT
ncbi:MAG: O-antigen ligase family protein [Flavobacteriales bacterium]|nr:O-antigen ligase family protein [Flavobacteriales bacterium]